MLVFPAAIQSMDGQGGNRKDGTLVLFFRTSVLKQNPVRVLNEFGFDEIG